MLASICATNWSIAPYIDEFIREVITTFCSSPSTELRYLLADLSHGSWLKAPNNFKPRNTVHTITGELVSLFVMVQRT
ncbi:hypothetical protein AG1IA_09092 [Rhizoctonia solani AG-1 IA]|uniref:Uncharacterized protein n=1 Tax=Thanatephorus cucumeris (strain AG1-IA) TaxID=983506 RepID=L8WJH5_THACA|nr:hypothetical protein AG1IA_09092 [Rhizoctonia solani AG-1 IA]